MLTSLLIPMSSPSFWSGCSVPPNKRLKLPAPTTKGSHLFVNNHTLRRSLGAIR
jgi:hypothetical protein